MPTKGSRKLKEIAGFELITRIGQGAMGSVFKARQKSLDRVVALKVLPPSIAKKDPAFVARFVREARASAALNHANIVQGIDVGQDKSLGLHYFAMEYIDGPTVGELLRKDGAIEERRALEITRSVADALVCAHAAKIIHRDIKPENILINSRNQPKLADLGLAKNLSQDSDPDEQNNWDDEDDGIGGGNEALTRAGASMGTPNYMSPEQVLGQNDLIGPQTDLYALGASLFHMVTGTTPFTGRDSREIMDARLDGDIPNARKFNPRVSRATSELIIKLMQVEQEDRVESADDLVRMISEILTSESGSATTKDRRPIGYTTSKKPPVGAARGRRTRMNSSGQTPTTYIGLGVAALVLVVLGIMFTRGGASRPQPKDKTVTKQDAETENKIDGNTATDAARKNGDNTSEVAIAEKEQDPSTTRKATTSESHGDIVRTKGKAAAVEEDPEDGTSRKIATTPTPANPLEQLNPIWREELARMDVPGAREALTTHARGNDLSVLEQTRLASVLEIQIERRARELTREIDALITKGAVDEAEQKLRSIQLGQPRDDSTAFEFATAIISSSRARLSKARERVVKRTVQTYGTTHGGPAALPAVTAEELEEVRFELATLMSARQDAAAKKVLTQAMKKPSLAPYASILKQDLAALNWPRDVREALAEGAKKLADGRAFSLKLTNGTVEKVGKGTNRKVVGVKGDKIRIEFTMDGISGQRPVPLNLVSRETRDALVVLGAGNDRAAIAAMKVKAAFTDLMGAAVTSDARTLRDVRRLLNEASAAGAPVAMLTTAEVWYRQVKKNSGGGR